MWTLLKPKETKPFAHRRMAAKYKPLITGPRSSENNLGANLSPNETTILADWMGLAVKRQLPDSCKEIQLTGLKRKHPNFSAPSKLEILI